MKPFAPGFDGDDVHPDREFVVAANIGFRTWFLDDPALPLRSIARTYRWEGRGPHTSMYITNPYFGPGPIVSRPDFPGLHNQVGFYGYYCEEVYTDTCPLISDDVEPVRVFGLVEGYGRSVAGRLGFRSEKAIISAFVMAESSVLMQRQPLFGHRQTYRPLLSEERDRLWSYLDKFYPTVPVFETTEQMLKVIPVTGKPSFS